MIVVVSFLVVIMSKSFFRKLLWKMNESGNINLKGTWLALVGDRNGWGKRQTPDPKRLTGSIRMRSGVSKYDAE